MIRVKQARTIVEDLSKDAQNRTIIWIWLPEVVLNKLLNVIAGVEAKRVLAATGPKSGDNSFPILQLTFSIRH